MPEVVNPTEDVGAIALTLPAVGVQIKRGTGAYETIASWNDATGALILQAGSGASADVHVLGRAALSVHVIDTTTGATTDQAYTSYRRGGVAKWRAGLNVEGLNVDNYTIYDVVNSVSRIRVSTSGVAFPNGSVIVGTDPGGAAILRVGGGVSISASLDVISGQGVTGSGFTLLSNNGGNLALGGAGTIAVTIGTTSTTGLSAGGLKVAANVIIGTDPGGSSLLRVGGALYASGIAGFGMAPVANNTVAAKGVTDTNASNIFLGQNSSGVTKFAVGSDGSMLVQGASTLQALTTTFVTISPPISTNAAAIQFSNTGGTYFIGVDNSAGGGIGTGVGYALGFIVPGGSAMRFDPTTRAATFTSTLTVNSTLIVGTDPGGSELVRIGGALRLSGNIIAPSLPTSVTGLAAGTLWNSGGTVHVA